MAGYYYDRREDETPGVVADAAFAALIQLFIPFPYNRLSESLSRINTGSQRFHFLNYPTFSAKSS